MEQYLQIGKIVNTHGFKGDVKVQPWCDGPIVITKLKCVYIKEKNEYKKLNIQKSTVHKETVLLKFDGIDDFDNANKLRDKVIYADRDDIDIEKGSFFIADLIGLDVIDFQTGKLYGKLKDVMKYGVHDIYCVQTEKGEVLVPAVKEFVKEISLDKGISIKCLEGMFDEI